ncbi:MAG: DUF2960 domain-containing protein, partial [Hydrococcus sp. CSU_1_8]|nr:DUF2960 domain-containing protein [Hydrococcus sp. CSU_1_8]
MPKTKLKFKKQSKTSQFANRLFEDLDGVKEAKPLDLKERLAQKRQARDVRRKIFSVLGISFVFAILVALPLGIAVNPRVGGSVAIGFPVLLLCFNYPRTALWVFLIYMPFNGTITYWIGQGNALFQLSKDAFYLPALLGLVLECRRRKLPILIPKKLLPSLGILIFCALLTLLFANGWQQTLPLCSQVPEAERFLRDGAGNLLLDANGIIIRRPCTDGGMP